MDGSQKVKVKVIFLGKKIKAQLHDTRHKNIPNNYQVIFLETGITSS